MDKYIQQLHFFRLKNGLPYYCIKLIDTANYYPKYNLDKEIWKQHPTHIILETSTHGQVRTVDRIITDKNGRQIKRKGKVLKQTPTKKGYLTVDIKINNKIKHRKVHRLVAETFLPNLLKHNQVNHLDGNTANNNLNNLEWCTLIDNLTHRYAQTKNRIYYNGAIFENVKALELAIKEMHPNIKANNLNEKIHNAINNGYPLFNADIRKLNNKENKFISELLKD